MVLLGDACHPMLPYLAQGANSSLEDGAVLGQLLGHMKNKSHLPQILRLYESLRKSRGEAIVKETFKQRHDFHMPDGEEQEKRDAIFLSQLGKEIKGAFPSRWTCPEVQPWLYGYNAIKEVEKAVMQHPELFARTAATLVPILPPPGPPSPSPKRLHGRAAAGSLRDGIEVDELRLNDAGEESLDDSADGAVFLACKAAAAGLQCAQMKMPNPRPLQLAHTAPLRDIRFGAILF
ncbi:hypothetical protein KXW43_005553 [Aspergillus fumigatus]|nr:hypothetical protein KXW43_005553 [Aspergillus fumigatus]